MSQMLFADGERASRSAAAAQLDAGEPDAIAGEVPLRDGKQTAHMGSGPHRSLSARTRAGTQRTGACVFY